MILEDDFDADESFRTVVDAIRAAPFPARWSSSTPASV